MLDSGLRQPERRRRLPFILRRSAWGGLLLALVMLEGDRQVDTPNRVPMPPKLASVRAEPLSPAAAGEGALRMGGLWRLTSDEPRFGGLSALALDRRRLVALSDSGVAIDWPAPGGEGRFRDLPDGPGPAQWKVNRDSEALLQDPRQGDWYVAFEQHHQLYRFDRHFRRAIGRRHVRLDTWWRNFGVEAMVSLPGGGMLLLPENGGEAIELGGGGERRRPLEAPGQIAEAARLQDGRVVVVLRRVRPWGIGNALGWLRLHSRGYRVEPFGTLALGRWDNVEGLAAEPLAGGGTRLWFVTDSDFRRRTVLGWVMVDAIRRPRVSKGGAKR